MAHHRVLADVFIQLGVSLGGLARLELTPCERSLIAVAVDAARLADAEIRRLAGDWRLA